MRLTWLSLVQPDIVLDLQHSASSYPDFSLPLDFDGDSENIYLNEAWTTFADMFYFSSLINGTINHIHIQTQNTTGQITTDTDRVDVGTKVPRVEYTLTFELY